MDDIRFAVPGTDGIDRGTLEVAQDKDGQTPVATCDRNGVALDHDGLDVEELLAATVGNVPSEPTADDDVETDGGTSMDDAAASAIVDPEFRCGRFLP